MKKLTKRLVSLFSAFALVGLLTFVTNGATASAQVIDKVKPVSSAQTKWWTWPPAPPTNPMQYIALGDSIAAGQGLATAADDEVRCGRTTEAYSFKVAETKGWTHQNMSCKGSTAGDLYTSQKVGEPPIPAQLKQAFAAGKPQVISITTGANDAQWAAFLNKCFATTCGSAADTANTEKLFAVMRLKLYYAMFDVQRRSLGNPPQVLLTGYYNPVSQACVGLDPRLTADEVTWLTGQVAALNQSLKKVADSYSFVEYVPVDFTGHDICSASSWVQGPTNPAPMHPTAAGQNAIAEAILTKL